MPSAVSSTRHPLRPLRVASAAVAASHLGDADYKGLAQVLAQRRAEFQVSTYGSTKIDWDLVVDTFVDEGRCEPRMTMIFKRAILRACSDEQAALLVSA